MKIIAGLGNPGLQYSNTRHNVGFMVADLLAKRLDITFSRQAFQSKIAEGRWGMEKVLLLKPQTFMNASGQALVEAVGFYKLDWEDVLIIHDDLDLLPGQVRVRAKGSAGGHRGMDSVITLSGTSNIPRIKIGIGHPLFGQVVDFVLQPLNGEDLPVIAMAVERAADAAMDWIAKGVRETMNLYNGLPGCGEKELDDTAQKPASEQAGSQE